jgi:TolB-like protein
VTESSRAVFLSYASQDVEPTRRIAEALRQRGIDVWFDQSELRGGDVWDQRIREQIRDCALFVPVISAHTQNRTEGYFRLEWKLAVDRSHLMASEKAFLLPVVIDATPQTEAFVPDRFRDVQWTRIPDGEATQRFVDLVKRLLDQPLTALSRLSSTTAAARRPRSVWRPIRWTALGLIVTGIAYLTIRATGLDPLYAAATANRHAESPTVIAEKSIAVLPFADLSEKKDQEYFSDGLAEELLDMLAKTPGLHVIARTSSFSFKGKSDDIPAIGTKLRVANILEGSVRKSGDQLIVYQAPVVVALQWRNQADASRLVIFCQLCFFVIWVSLAVNFVIFFRDSELWHFIKPVYGLIQRSLFVTFCIWLAGTGLLLRNLSAKHSLKSTAIRREADAV